MMLLCGSEAYFLIGYQPYMTKTISVCDFSFSKIVSVGGNVCIHSQANLL